MSPSHFVGDLALTVAGGAMAGWIARKLGLHPILGYVVAGIVVGPFTPGYVTETDNLAILAELGLVFLLFTIGLEFSLPEIKRIGSVPLLLSIAAAIVLALAGAAVAILMHLPGGFTLGLVLVVSSTAVGIALLQEAGLANERLGKLVVSIMIVQDLLAIVILVLIDQPAGHLSALGLVKPLIVTGLFVVLALTLGAALAKRLVAQTMVNSPEDQRVAVFAGIALVAAYLGHLCGLSYAFGAFVAGAVLAEQAERPAVERVIAPFKDLFVLCFFVAIGSLIDPSLILANWVLVVIMSAAIIVVRWLVWWFFAVRCGFTGTTAVVLGIAMIPLGEFNVVLGQSAKAAQRLSDVELSVCIGVMFVSIVAATLAQPIVMRFVKPGLQAEPALTVAE